MDQLPFIILNSIFESNTCDNHTLLATQYWQVLRNFISLNFYIKKGMRTNNQVIFIIQLKFISVCPKCDNLLKIEGNITYTPDNLLICIPRSDSSRTSRSYSKTAVPLQM